MKEHNPYITSLFQKYLDGNYSEQELDVLLAYFKHDEDSEQLKVLIEEALFRANPSITDEENLRTQVAHNRKVILSKIRGSRKRLLYRWPAIAAAITIFISISLAVYYFKSLGRSNNLTSKFGDDVLPGGNHAYITLSTGQQLKLDESKEGLTTTDGKLAYSDGTAFEAGADVLFATVHTPVGGQYHITLPDGSEAWLNAESTLKYPMKFGKERRLVETTGEVYLEVKSDRSKPFFVQTGDQRLKVLGTAFNIRNYSSKPITTLLHGSIMLENTKNNESVTLRPGEQSRIDDQAFKVSKVDPSDYVGWKDGTFSNHDASLKEACQELGRWYSVHFTFPQGFKNSEKAYILIDRREKLSSVLEGLQSIYKVDFEISGKEVIVRE